MPSDPLSLALLALAATSLWIAAGMTWVSALARRGLHDRRSFVVGAVAGPLSGLAARAGRRPAELVPVPVHAAGRETTRRTGGSPR